MANPDISLLGATYPGVTGVTLPKSGGGTATFPWVEGSETKTQNGTYNVTNLAELVVNVSGGGGSSWTKILSYEKEISTTSGTASNADTVIIGSQYFTNQKIIWVHIRDKSGKRAGYHYGSDGFFVNRVAENGGTSNFTSVATVSFNCADGTTDLSSIISQYGVYAYSISPVGELTIRKRYSSNNSRTINSTYVIDVYALDPPTGVDLFPD